VEPFHEAGLQAGGRVAMQDAFSDGLIQAGKRLGHLLLGLFRISFGQDLTNLPQVGPQDSLVPAVPICAAERLPRALECGKMICHSFPCTLLKNYLPCHPERSEGPCGFAQGRPALLVASFRDKTSFADHLPF
jgi:hypothetical protein